MLNREILCAILVAAAAGCSHGGTGVGVPRADVAPTSCYWPGSGEFPEPLPSGLNLRGSWAKGITGSLDKEAIRRAMRRDLREIQACYRRALVRQPGLTGRVVIQFVITGNGAVSDSRLLSSTLGSVETETCLAERACGWQFPPTKGGGPILVAYPFAFIPDTPPEP